ncbi:NADPH:quinone reductase [Brevibacterium marinum]|uniref:NADPH:quinone reductase-like Zn-dependent oxidoreductase n=1 Tax=Brevibacterium marinum TaxID=418643 RepID=A0A846RWI9_9MICO|nr:NADPH:quinone reductase [Brevibacterium marinum]NJC55815.1 NADPH:quinone reductase-like Zn-dependent oxidoreductase [Brevibacterium marinum]
MKAAFVNRLGGVEEIRYGDLPEPVPGPTDCLVEVAAVSLNPVDTFVRSGRFSTAVPLPFILGRDLVGTVVSAPPGTSLARGQTVWCDSLGYEGRQGSYAELAVVPADRLYPAPSGIEAHSTDAHRLVALAHPATTAWLGWFEHGRLVPGDTVFVGGGAGNVGNAAIRLAAAAGARIVASSHSRDFDTVRAAGAEVVLDYRDPDLPAACARAAPEGFDLVWDTSGHHDGEFLAEATAPGARVLITASAAPNTEVPLGRLYTKDVSLIGFVMSRTTADQLARAAKGLTPFLRPRAAGPLTRTDKTSATGTVSSAGALTTAIAEVLPLSEAARAHRMMETGEIRGRVVLTP